MGGYEERLIFIFMNFKETLEMNEKSQKNQVCLLTKKLISQLLIALECQTWYQSNAKTTYSYLIVKYEII